MIRRRQSVGRAAALPCVRRCLAPSVAGRAKGGWLLIAVLMAAVANGSSWAAPPGPPAPPSVASGGVAVGDPAPLDVAEVSASLRELIDLQVAGARASDTFEPRVGLAVFRHLSMVPGQVLDYVPNDWEGLPWVYARPTDGEPFDDLEAVRAAHPEAAGLGHRARFGPAFLASIRTDGTAAGYLQLALFALQGRQFRLKGGANYLNLTILLDRERLEWIIKNRWLRPENVEPARKIDLTPTVVIGDEAVTARYVVFADEGLVEIRWTVTRAPPHRVTGVTWTCIVPDRPTIRH